ncbi:MAG: hypothetical protein H6Q74_2291 [Firmicutes bacterium]|nr:hypothetical protein [Bacillota bacterium]
MALEIRDLSLKEYYVQIGNYAHIRFKMVHYIKINLFKIYDTIVYRIIVGNTMYSEKTLESKPERFRIEGTDSGKPALLRKSGMERI